MCITLKAGSQQDYTTVSNIFIDNYMPQANGEFVKIYLYLLRCMSDPAMDLSISTLADKFDQTEKDVNRALRYLAGKGLISIEYGPDDELCAITFLPVSSEIAVVPDRTSTLEKDTGNRVVIQNSISVTNELPGKPVYTADKLQEFGSNDEISQLLYIAQKYIGRPLSPTESQTIFYLYDSLHFSAELIEYLIETCVSRGHKSMHYIEKVGLDWASAGVTNIDEAREYAGKYSKNVYSVMKAFGLNGRNPAPTELKYINTWYQEYGFDLDLILEACNRTIQTIHKPNFEYADTILRKWKQQNVTRLEDIAALDLQHTSKRQTAPVRQTGNNKFNNYPQPAYDFEQLEKILQTQ